MARRAASSPPGRWVAMVARVRAEVTSQRAQHTLPSPPSRSLVFSSCESSDWTAGAGEAAGSPGAAVPAPGVPPDGDVAPDGFSAPSGGTSDPDDEVSPAPDDPSDDGDWPEGGGPSEGEPAGADDAPVAGSPAREEVGGEVVSPRGASGCEVPQETSRSALTKIARGARRGRGETRATVASRSVPQTGRPDDRTPSLVTIRTSAERPMARWGTHGELGAPRAASSDRLVVESGDGSHQASPGVQLGDGGARRRHHR